MTKTTRPRPGPLQRSESPIEDLMTMALFAFVVICEEEEFEFFPQVEVEGYRVDFLVHLNRRAVVVEVDGHEWHEKTKEQAKRDKSRDRKILARGYPVMRFTGSEVYNDPLGCVQEVYDFLAGQS